MTTYKTTPEDFQVFKEAVAYWQNRLGLLNWHIYTRHRLKREFQAQCATDLTGRCATITLSKVLYNYDEPPGRTGIRRIAFHEVCELFLARMDICARTRFVQGDEIEEARHEIIRTLEKVIFDNCPTPGAAQTESSPAARSPG
jgi:hypothetical protein